MPTSYDVAEAAGVSQMTVSRAFDPAASIREETRARILAAASDIGYVHNSAAANLASDRRRAIGIILPTLQDSIYLPVVEGARAAFEERKETFFLQAIDYDRNKEQAAINSLLSQRVRAMLLPSIGHATRSQPFLRALPIPVIETGNLPANPLHAAVGHSDFEAGELATQHLIASGRKRIAMICGHPNQTSNSRDRLRGYAAALRKAGLTQRSELIAFTDHSAGGALAALERIRATRIRFDAILAAGELWSPPVLLSLLRDGVRVPHEVAVMSVGDPHLSEHFPVALSTVVLPRRETGRIAAEMAMSSGPIEGKSVKLPVELLLRESA